MTELRVKHTIHMPEDIVKIKDVFVAKGFKLFLVGGSVRDALLGKEPKDFDLATDATPDFVIGFLKGKPFVKNILETGKAFGVVNVITPSGEFEIATFRKDLSAGRRPDGVEFTSIYQDVKRRDLTINALFFDIDAGEIVDLVGGIEDLRNGVIKTVGKPEDRFGEDRLRIMRAIRFAARFDSALDPAIETALKADSSMEGISAERIRDEFMKAIKSAKSILYLLALCNEFRLFRFIFGDLSTDLTVIREGSIIDEEKDPAVLIAHLLKRNDVDMVAKELNRLTFTTDEVSQIVFLLRMLDFKPEMVQKFKKAQNVSKIASESLRRFMVLNGSQGKWLNVFLDFKLTVTGDDMMKLGMKPGPEMGKAIEQAEFLKFMEYL